MVQAASAAAPVTGPETVSVEAAAKRLGLSRSLAYQLARQGALAPGIPVLRFGRKLAIPARALDRLLLVDDPSAAAPAERVA
jgi:excisionase family DNA binding protein